MIIVSRFSFFVALVVSYAAALVGAAEVKLTIPNQLNHTWPGELVSFDLDPGKVAGVTVMEIQGRTRPVQIEQVDIGGRLKSRVWTYVTIEGKDAEGEKLDISTVPAILKSGRASAGIKLSRQGDYYLIDNGTYQFRLHNYRGKLSRPTELSKLPHWVGGMKTIGQKNFDGRAYFESRAVCTAAKTEILQQGPVFIDFKITYQFEQPEDEPTDPVEAMPLALGKQSHLFKPNQPPREALPARTNSYEVLVRFVMDDPWIDVNERFHFPRDPEANAYGVTQYYIEWGEQGLKVDTATWVRWFEYDVFGGNVDQKYVPARPRPAQKGRPFALLRPKWNQGGGGAQDFVLTSGGPPPKMERKKVDGQWVEVVKTPAASNYDPENPAAGVIAAYASKWVGPYANYIPVYVYDGRWGKARFPMTDGERSEMHYGQRAYGLLVGPRRMFTSLNSVVRRHTDWTLTAQINKYILEWRRNPKLAGPNVLISREELSRLQAEYISGRDTPINRILRDAKRELDELTRQRERTDDRDELKAIDKKLRSDDFDLVRLITENASRDVRMPDSGLWRGRRYQDDFLNPTSSPTRGIPGFAKADLFAAGQPLGGASQAAFGYIATDLDAWPGWHQGWRPGNPNFHTDKYMAALYVGGALRDHPHAREWLQFGYENFMDDQRKVLFPPDGVGFECPGYSGYSMKLQLAIARILLNAGYGNVIANNPLVKKNGAWHRKLITPYDRRIERRHEAPLGDTHRWDSGLYASGYAKLARFFKEKDPKFASEMMGAWKLLVESKPADTVKLPSLMEEITQIDRTIRPTPADEMDWSSQAFEGFGAILRTGFGTPAETFLTLKAGSARGHYHNDEASFHYYADGTPVALDYNCSYSPRGDHGALHNAMTFGRTATLYHNGRGDSVPAMEENGASAKVVDFVSTDAADLCKTERVQSSLTMRPIYPQDNEFGRHYESRTVQPITHRRTLMMIKHVANSPLTDYLVVRDETDSSERQQVNLHLLAREVSVEGDTVNAVGQWDKDMIVYLAEATDPEIEVRSWHYHDDWMVGPDEYVLRKGESMSEWKSRMESLMKKHRVRSLPLKDWKPTWQNPKEPASQAWAQRIRETEGRALCPPPYWNASWMYGEYQVWLRIHTRPGTPVLWVLYPYKRGEQRPTIERLEEGGVRVAIGSHTDEIRVTDDGIEVVQNGKVTRLGK